ncbi:MAG TPA: D-alanyl-D-alanine carboxypeptidase family protein [Acetobacteraceae bacterium]|nr:D-alanyl-D-alanine carboxypeptidase family protein [Acetobacteraceae bacterium]
MTSLMTYRGASRRSLLLGAACGLLPAFALHAEPAAPGIETFPKLVGKGAVKRSFTPASSPLGPIGTKARWAFITDYNTGAVLLEKDPTAPMPPSSMTKLMTLYIVYSLLKSGQLTLDQALPVSEAAWRTGGSKMFVPLGGNISVADLIQGIEVDSGNDACIVLAEGISGSVPAFVERMNETAAKIGLVESHFMNPTGLPEPGHYMCCQDIATLARLIIRNFPQYYHYASEKVFTFSKIKQYNRNPLVQDNLADGLKTGFTDAGGYGLCASAIREGRRVILVLNGMPSESDRAEEAERLLDWSFNEFTDVTLFKAGETVAEAKVWLGKSLTVPLAGTTDLVATMPREWRRTATIRARYASPLPAPIAAGQQLGTLVVAGQGVPAGQQFTLVAGTTVPRLTLVERSLAVLFHMVFGGMG